MRKKKRFQPKRRTSTQNPKDRYQIRHNSNEKTNQKRDARYRRHQKIAWGCNNSSTGFTANKNTPKLIQKAIRRRINQTTPHTPEQAQTAANETTEWGNKTWGKIADVLR